MTVKLNSFEGGSDETAISAGNSGGISGDAFDSDILLSNFDTLRAAHGTLSCRCSLSAQSSAHVSWATAGGTWYGRVAFYLTASPPAGLFLVRFLDTATDRLSFTIRTDRTVRMLNSAFADVGTSSTVLALDQWNGLEFNVIQGGPAANLAQCKIYTDPHFESPVETVNAASATIGAWNRIRIGVNFSAVQTYTGHVDSMGISDVGYLGNTGLVIPRRALAPAGLSVQRAASW